LCRQTKVYRTFEFKLTQYRSVSSVSSVANNGYNPYMPIYEYECRKCKAHVEAFQKVSDKPLTKCRKCGGKLERKISAPAIQFKGSGWYVTDYAGKTTKGEKSESESAPETTADKPEKTEKKTKESSPAKKTTDKPSSPKASTGD
jgi:putative FmdB family regulatory protein